MPTNIYCQRMTATISSGCCRSFRAQARESSAKVESGVAVWDLPESELTRLLTCGLCAEIIDSEFIGRLMTQVADRADQLVTYLMREDDYGSQQERARARKLRWYHANRDEQVEARRERRRREKTCRQQPEIGLEA